MEDYKKTEQNKKDFPPGSIKAIKAGCLCNPEKNNHGKGYNNKYYMWLINTDCKLHWFDNRISKRKKRIQKDI